MQTQNVAWLSFGISTALTRTCLHFFPAADNVGAPYPVNCTLTLFGANQDRKSITLEGARLNHPDGLRLEDAFPQVRDVKGGLFAFFVEMASSQPRVDMSTSACVTEIDTKDYIVRFLPRRAVLGESPLAPDSPVHQQASAAARTVLNPYAPFMTGIAVQDSSLTTSIMIVNGSSKQATLTLGSPGPAPMSSAVESHDNAAAPMVQIHQSVVEAFSISEIPMTERVFEERVATETSWGEIKSRQFMVGVYASSASSSQIPGSAALNNGQKIGTSRANTAITTFGVFVIYRDKGSGRIMSVVTL